MVLVLWCKADMATFSPGAVFLAVAVWASDGPYILKAVTWTVDRLLVVA